MSGFGSAISEHPVSAIATGEVVGAVLEAVGESPGLAVCFVTPGHAGAFEDVTKAINDILHPDVLTGAVASSVVGPGREVEKGPAISLWATSEGVYSPVHLSVADDGLSGWPELPFEPETLILIGDPFSFPAEDFLLWIDENHPRMSVVGGMASAGRVAGANSLVLGTKIHRSGAVGALVGPGVEITAVVSQGSKPFGRPFVVTKSDRNVIYELAGKPALERLVAQASADLSEDDVELLASGGLQIGRVMDEHLEEFATGDFLIRNVIGTDPKSGAIAVGDVVPVGVTVQFHLRDAVAADEDLDIHLAGRDAEAALLFTCNGRGAGLFGSPDHDAGAIVDHLGPIPTSGFFAAGEIGPVGGRNFLHGFTASMALFRSASTTVR
jgi:small ligand-binding sensory domain FIST